MEFAEVRFGGFWRTADQSGTPGMPLDPLLDTLADQGGPTKTHALASGSPAQYAGDSLAPQAVTTTLAGTIDGATAMLGVREAGLLPDRVPFALRIETEIVSVLGMAGGSLFVRRGAHQTQPAGHAAGALVELLADQRGASRLFGDEMDPGASSADIGAYERLPALSISASDAVHSEGDPQTAPTTQFVFTVTRAGADFESHTVDYAVVPSGSHPAAAADFDTGQFPAGTLTFDAGVSEQQVVIEVVTDTILELDEQFAVVLSNPSDGAEIVRASARGTITNDDAATISVSDVTLAEGSGGEFTDFTFDVLLAGGVEGGFQLAYTTNDGSATTAGYDYFDRDGTRDRGALLFAGDANETQPITVRVFPDEVVELDETFNVLLGALTGLVDPSLRSSISVQSAAATGTITNDDTATLSVANVTRAESDTATVVFQFDIKLSHAVDVPLSVTAATADVTATAGDDYDAVSTTVNFAGLVQETQSVSVAVYGDTNSEGDETFSLALSALQAAGRESSISLGGGTATIVDDEGPILSVGDVVQLESDGGLIQFMFTVTLNNPPGGEVNVDVATQALTATAGDDFTHAFETLYFMGDDGETQTFTVDVNGDQTVELDESFRVLLSNVDAMDEMGEPYLGPFALVPGTGIIQADDAATLSIDDVQVTEGDPQAPALQFTITLSHDVDVPVRFKAVTREAAALAGDRYNTQSQSLLYGDNDFDSQAQVFELVGQADETATFSVPLHADALLEAQNEMFTAELVGVEVGGRNVIGSIGYGTAVDGPYPPPPPPCEEDPHAADAGTPIWGEEYWETIWPDGIDEDPFWIAIGWIPHTDEDLYLQGDSTECPAPSQPEEDPPPPPPTPPTTVAEWVVSHNGSVTFNPFSSFNYRLADDVAVTVGSNGQFTEIGGQRPLTYGTITVNADMTLTYTPNGNLTGSLIQEHDMHGYPYRYTDFERFEAHLVDHSVVSGSGGGGESSGATAFASVPVEIPVSDHRPVLRGMRIADQQAGFRLDSDLFADHDITYRIDLRDVFRDPDGPQDFANLKILGLKHNTEQVPAEIDENTEYDGSELKLEIPIAEYGSAPTTKKELVIERVSQWMVDIHNPIQLGDTNLPGWSTASFPAQLDIELLVTDGRKELNSDDLPEYVIWPFTLPIVPNTDISSSHWKANTTAPQVDFRPWALEVQPALPGRSPTSAAASWTVAAAARAASLKSQPAETVGGTDVDLANGTLRRYHPLILDGSGGASELALPGLVYDSATVDPRPVIQALVKGDSTPSEIQATLTWYDHRNSTGTAGGRQVVTNRTFTPTAGNEFLIALQVAEAPIFTGVYGWELELDIALASETVTLRTAGETAVIVEESVSYTEFNTGSELRWDRTAVFGAGWQLDGVPALHLDERHDDDIVTAIEAVDDRFILAFPGLAPRTFNAKELTLSSAYSGPLKSIQLGSATIGSDGYADPLEFGTLRAQAAGDEIVYDDGTGAEYVFKRFIVETNPVDGTSATLYLIDRIEQPGLDFDPANPPADRRGISFERNAAGRLDAIVASDGVKTELVYDTTSGYLSALRLPDPADVNNPFREVELQVSGDGLTEIRHKNWLSDGTTANDQVRVFAYSGGRLTQDQWYDHDPADPARLVRHTEYGYDATTGLLSSVQLGSVAEGNVLSYTIHPAAQVGLNGQPGVELDLIGKSEIAASDLEKYDEALEQAASQTGTYITENLFTLEGLRFLREEFFELDGGPSAVSLRKEWWLYDQIGMLQMYTDPLGADTLYWHDYETPVYYDQTDPHGASDDQPKYDPDDYRGNVTFVMGPSGFTRYEYETDDEGPEPTTNPVQSLSLGRLVKKIARPVIDSDGNTPQGGTVREVVSQYEHNLAGQLLVERTIRGENDADATSVPPGTDDRVQTWTYAGGLLASYTDPRGLTTTYTYDSARRLETAVVTDQGVDRQPNQTADDEVRTTQYVYDPDLGYLDEIVLYNGSTSGEVISRTQQDHDAQGRLLERRLLNPDAQLLSRQQYGYAADGVVSSVFDGNGVETESKYNTAGLLTELVQAKGQTHYSLYTGSAESIEQTTTYSYYADGTLRQTVLPGGITESFYADPLSRQQWTETDGVSAGEHVVNGPFSDFHLAGRRVTRTELDVLGRQTRSVDLLTGGELETERGESGKDRTRTTYRVGPQGGPQRETTVNRAAAGQVERVKTPGRGAHQQRYDELGNLGETTNLTLGLSGAAATTNGAGDVIQHVERRGQENGGGWLTRYFYTDLEYDQQGRLRKTIDMLTDGSPAIADEPGASPATVDYQFDTARKLTKVTHTSRAGNFSFQWFDAAGRLVEEQNQLGGVTTYTYDLAGNLVEQQFNPASGDTLPSRRTQYQYDGLGRVRATILHGGQPIFAATDYFLPDAANSDQWNVVAFIPLEIIDSVNFAVSNPATYALPLGFSNVQHLATRSRLDSLGNPYYVQQPDPTPNAGDTPTLLVTYNYVPQLQATAVTTRLSVADNATAASADIDTTHPQNRVSRQVANADGQTILNAQRLSNLDQSDYSQVNAAIDGGTLDPATVGPNDVYLQFIEPKDAGFQVLVRNEYYSTSGLLERSIDGHNQETSYSYTVDGLLETVTQPNGEVTSYKYDTSGNRLRLVYNSGQGGTSDTRWRYDALGRVFEETTFVDRLDASGLPQAGAPPQPLTRTWKYQGNTLDYTDRDGRLVTTSNNPIQRETSEIAFYDDLAYSRTEHLHSDGSLQAIDELLTETGSTLYDSDLSYIYDDFGRVDQATHGFEFGNYQAQSQMGLTYQPAGERGSLELRLDSDPANGTPDFVDVFINTYAADPLSRTTDIEQIFYTSAGALSLWAGGQAGTDKDVALTYLADGSRDSLTRSIGGEIAKTTYQYHADGRAQRIEHAKTATSPGVLLAAYDFTYDNAQRLSARSVAQYDGDSQTANLLFDSTSTFSYDAGGQLSSASETITVPTSSNETHTYPNGQSSDSTVWTIGRANRLYQDDDYIYEYDLEGRLIEKRATGAAEPAKVRYQWDHNGRLLKVEELDSADQLLETVRYGYDALGRKVGREVSNAAGTVTSASGFLYDGLTVLAEVDFLDSGQLTGTYLLGPGVNEVLATDRADAAATHAIWSFADPLGTVRSLGWHDSSTGDWKVLHQNYSEFGRQEELLGDTAFTPLADSPVLFAGHQFDPDTGLVDMKARWYDPATGRFLMEDPIGFKAGDGNLYRYVENDPTGRVDPTGLDDVREHMNPDELFWYNVTLPGWHRDPDTVVEVLLRTREMLPNEGVSIGDVWYGHPAIRHAIAYGLEMSPEGSDNNLAMYTLNDFRTREVDPGDPFYGNYRRDHFYREDIDYLVKHIQNVISVSPFRKWINDNYYVADAFSHSIAIGALSASGRPTVVPAIRGTGNANDAPLNSPRGVKQYSRPIGPEPAAKTVSAASAREISHGVIIELRLSRAQFTAAEQAAIEFKYSVANGRIAAGAETSEIGAQVKYRYHLSQRFVRDTLQPGVSNYRNVRIPENHQVDEFVPRQYGGRQVQPNQWLMPNENYLNNRLGPIERGATQHLPDGTPIRGWRIVWEE